MGALRRRRHRRQMQFEFVQNIRSSGWRKKKSEDARDASIALFHHSRAVHDNIAVVASIMRV